MLNATLIEGNTWAVSETNAEGVLITRHKVAIKAGGTAADAVTAIEDMQRGPSPVEVAAQKLRQRVITVKGECRRRIYLTADAYAQINLSSDASAGLLDATQMATYRIGLAWVKAMRAACALIAADPQLDHKDDANWPAVPPGVAELAALF